MIPRGCLGDALVYAAIGLIAPPVVLVLGALNCFIGLIVLIIGIIIGKHARQRLQGKECLAHHHL